MLVRRSAYKMHWAMPRKRIIIPKTGKAGEFEFSYLGEDYVTEHLLIQE